LDKMVKIGSTYIIHHHQQLYEEGFLGAESYAWSM
jgi:hypothetical protein